jgi:hypothetical protein
MSEFTNLDYWKAIILYGLNNATYKIALGKTLLDLQASQQGQVQWSLLSETFLNNYLAKLEERPMPQQANPARITVMERIIAELKTGRISKDQAISDTGIKGFNDVIPRFHSIGTNTEMVRDRFYEVEFGRAIRLKDELFMLGEEDVQALYEELHARWNLLEGAFAINQTQSVLQNDDRLIYIQNGYSRTDITGNIPFLSAYQGNTCFYCGEPIIMGDIHVDHVLPRQVVCHDEIWNLVLAHSYCNELKSDRLVATYYIEKLISRNENIMGSNHPWKKRIEEQLGKNKVQRRSTLQYQYGQVSTILGAYYWGGMKDYIPEKDDFYRKLITRLNNG